MAIKHDIVYVNYYTDGTAARKIAPAFPVREDVRMPKRRAQKRKVLYVDPVAIMSIAIAILMLIMMGVGLSQFHTARQQMEQMENYVNELRLENDLLQIHYDANVDLESVEKTALALGMVPKEQVQVTSIYVSVPQKAEVELSPWNQFMNFLVDLFA